MAIVTVVHGDAVVNTKDVLVNCPLVHVGDAVVLVESPRALRSPSGVRNKLNAVKRAAVPRLAVLAGSKGSMAPARTSTGTCMWA